MVTDQEKIVVVITDGNLRRMLLKTENLTGILAKDLMSANPKTVDKKSSKCVPILFIKSD